MSTSLQWQKKVRQKVNRRVKRCIMMLIHMPMIPMRFKKMKKVFSIREVFGDSKVVAHIEGRIR